MSLLARSDALHTEVRAFAAGTNARGFAELAREIAEFQAEFSPGYARLVAAAAPAPSSVERLPGVPSEVFALARVAVHPGELDTLRFKTSGTSSGARGIHALRVTETYRALALAFGREALLRSDAPTHIVALAPRPTIPASSSLGFMMTLFMEHFDTRGASARDLTTRFLIDERGLDLPALERALQRTRESGEPLLVLATSFALVELLDRLGTRTLGAHAQTTVMQTGGFKGKSREIPASELRAGIARAFGIPEGSVVGEYGMTELTSQMYEATLRGSALNTRYEGLPGRYYEPPWLRVIPVDPVALEPVADGEVGIARIIDLGNVDSAVCIQTRDLVRRHDRGFELLGRAAGAVPRGCSLSIEEFLAAARQAPSVQAEIRAPRAMTRTSGVVSNHAKRRARLEPLLTAARQLADPNHARGQAARGALAGSSDLSSQGIDFALENSLETQPSEAELACLLSSAPECQRAHVLLSAGVFTAAHRAIAIALGASEQVCVRPSRRDPEMARLLLAGAPGCFAVVDALAPTLGDHVWAYGRDQTLDQLALELPAKVVLHRHGAGFGVALLTESEGLDLAALADALARDVVLFDQRGCLSPRVLLVHGSQRFAERTAAALASALSSFEERVPLGRLRPNELAESAQYRESARYAAQLVPAGRGFVSLADADEWLLPPVGRNLHVLATHDPVRLLERWRRYITTVGLHASVALEHAIVDALPGARVAAFGHMQTPPFDGPVDRRLE
ncbi:MAG TPA: acyl-CoA reductase [Polyangiaceae bacterium]